MSDAGVSLAVEAMRLNDPYYQKPLGIRNINKDLV